MKRICLANQKGGVGKTATTLNLGAAMSEYGRKTLLVDFDPQGHLSKALGIELAPDGGANLARALLGQWSGELGDLLVPYRPNLYVIPSSLEMFTLPSQMYAKPGREYLLSRFLDALDDVFDICLIDSQPALEVMTDNALVAARHRPGHGGQVLIPVQAEDSSFDALRLLLHQVQTLREVLQIDIDLGGLIVNQYDSRRGLVATSSLEAFKEMAIGVLAVIGDRKEIKEGWRYKIPVVEHAPKSDPARWYRQLAADLLEVPMLELETV